LLFLKSKKSAIRIFALFCTFSLVRSFQKSDPALALFVALLKRAKKERLHNPSFEKSEKVRCAIVRMPFTALSLKSRGGLKRAKKCDLEILTFLHIFAHSLFSKERLCEKGKKKSGRTIALLKRAKMSDVRLCECLWKVYGT